MRTRNTLGESLILVGLLLSALFSREVCRLGVMVVTWGRAEAVVEAVSEEVGECRGSGRGGSWTYPCVRFIARAHYTARNEPVVVSLPAGDRAVSGPGEPSLRPGQRVPIVFSHSAPERVERIDGHSFAWVAFGLAIAGLVVAAGFLLTDSERFNWFS